MIMKKAGMIFAVIIMLSYASIANNTKFEAGLNGGIAFPVSSSLSDNLNSSIFEGVFFRINNVMFPDLHLVVDANYISFSGRVNTNMIMTFLPITLSLEYVPFKLGDNTSPYLKIGGGVVFEYLKDDSLASALNNKDPIFLGGIGVKMDLTSGLKLRVEVALNYRSFSANLTSKAT